MRSAWLFVGSTPSIVVNSHNAGYNANRLTQKVAALESAHERPCSKILWSSRNSLHPSLQGRTVDLAVAERPPVGEQAVDDFQAGSANGFSGSSSIDQLLKITFQSGRGKLGENEQGGQTG